MNALVQKKGQTKEKRSNSLVLKRKQAKFQKPGISAGRLWSDGHHHETDFGSLPGFHFSSLPLPGYSTDSIQPKLTIGRPNDRYEQEADRVAEEVMRMPSEAEPVSLGLKRIIHQRGGGNRREAPPIVYDVLHSPGRPLDTDTRHFMEARFGHDFSGVRVHTGPAAAHTARSIHATAFTIGQNVVFGQSAYQPGTEQGKRLVAHELTHVIQQACSDQSNHYGRIDREADESEAAVFVPHEGSEDIEYAWDTGLAILEIRQVLENRIGPLLSEMNQFDYLFDEVYDVYWGLAQIERELSALTAGQEPSKEQYGRINDYQERWDSIKDRMAARNRRQVRNDLRRAKEEAEKLRTELLYTYRDVHNAGSTPDEIQVSGGSLKDVAENVKDLLIAINDADAQLTGRSVTPLIPVLNKSLSIVNLLAGWEQTSGLATESQQNMAHLQNLWSGSTTAIGLIGLGKHLPLFSHIGPMLNVISQQFDVIVSAIQEQNKIYWQLRDVLGSDVRNPHELPGGKAVFDYMRAVFRSSEPLSETPSGDVLQFFLRNRRMFDDIARDVKDRPWATTPVERRFLFGSKIDEDRFNSWVFYNRTWVWRAIYGRGMEPPR